MQIRTLFLLCMSAVAALTACLSGWVLLQTIVDYQLADRVERVVDIDSLLFVVSDKIAVERPLVGDALLAEDAAGEAVLARLAAVRRMADDALDRVGRRIAAQSYDGAAVQLRIVQRTRDDLAAWRQRVDAMLGRPKRERDANMFGYFIAGLNAVFEAADSALDVGDMAATLHDGTTVELMALSRYIWGVRSAMGARTVPLMATIDRSAPLDPAQLEAQARFDGTLSANWTPITALSRRLSALPDVLAAIDAARGAFLDYDRLCHDVIAASRAGSPYPVSALVLGQTVVRTAPVLLRIRDEALAAARDRVRGTRQAAAAHVLVASLVLALTVFAMIGVLFVLQRRIVLPVVALTDVIARIARLDFNVAIPARKRMDEIGRMAAALEALRDGAMAGEANKVRIEHMARHDALTGLPNRLVLQDRLEQAVARAGRGQTCAVLCLDLDRFKAVNDTFGHPTGDLLLRSVGTRLLACVREVDTVSRLGGDEFVVLLMGIEHAEQAALVAGRIVRALGEPFDLDGQQVGIGCSVGIAVTPLDALSAVGVLKCADTALYRAKSEDKGSFRFFKPDMDEQLRERMSLEHDLRLATQAEAFELVYQPQYTLATGRLCGFEALLRWPHPVRGTIGPANFIPIAEETGLIVPIGAWVVRQACTEAMLWPGDVMLAVNLSGVQFKNPDLVRTVCRALADSGLPAARLELEITETALLTNSAVSLAMLQELHGMGIRIAMDDFGTGYSSLSYLRKFPFDKIKIDQTFIRDLTVDAGARAIVRAVVALGDSLGMTTTAEGVETAEQLAELRRQGCTDVQGYLFSRPVPPAAARALAGRAGVAAAVG